MRQARSVDRLAGLGPDRVKSQDAVPVEGPGPRDAAPGFCASAVSSESVPSAEPGPVTVGVIRDAWGIAGAFKVEPFNSPAESVLKTARRWRLRSPDPSDAGSRAAGPPTPGESANRLALRPASGSSVVVHIKRCRVHGEFLVAQAQGTDTRSAAEALKGLLVELDRADFPRTAAGEYYWVDLIGCAVYGQRGVALGRVVSLDDHGAHAILVVHDGEVERLIPFVEAYLVNVDLDSRRIELDWSSDW